MTNLVNQEKSHWLNERLVIFPFSCHAVPFFLRKKENKYNYWRYGGLTRGFLPEDYQFLDCVRVLFCCSKYVKMPKIICSTGLIKHVIDDFSFLIKNYIFKITNYKEYFNVFHNNHLLYWLSFLISVERKKAHTMRTFCKVPYSLENFTSLLPCLVLR